jgi:hypothetical protein
MKSHRESRKMNNGCAEWTGARAVVDGLYNSGRWDEVFKGKWYAEILASQIVAVSPNPVDRRALAAVLVKQVAGTMTFDSSWCRDVQRRIRGLSEFLMAA